MGKRVLVGGCFDIIHPAHIKMLTKAREIAGEGGELIVVIARDRNVRRLKGRDPIVPEESRRFIVENLKPVDKAVLGSSGDDLLKIVCEIKPDVIALGYDQPFDENELKQALLARGLEVEVIRLPKYNAKPNSTTEILSRVKQLLESS
ncbi:MAG: FAD synthase [Thermoproteota archaeon]|nr:MAG: FAD synthase [Candidatus Korarchaeota archaeon]RLG56157.1 MAG: FAD synthase [Candidatus Korarchaeota archaeon]